MDKASPAVHAVVVTWQGGAWLARCLDSLAAAPLQRVHLVVTAGAPVPLPTSLWDRVQVHRTPAPAHFALGANLGLTAAAGHDVLLLNDDTELLPGALEALLGARHRHGPGMYQPRILLADDETRLDNEGHGLWPDGFNLARGRGRSDPGGGRPATFSGAAVLLTRELLAACGGFDADLQAFGEDVDLSLRAARRGFALHAVPDARVRHALGASYGRADRRKLHLVERNRIRAAVRSLPASALCTMPLWTTLRLAALAAAAGAGRGLGSTVAPADLLGVATGTLSGLRHLPDALRKRRSDAVGWTVGDAAMWGLLRDGRVRADDLWGRA
ncbi:MAG: glycosyltransferase family 2 protein [Alphaproteobacteria bacterium]|nr:glycosyltransferase family 2 protein [Alphaproteobacteria bacterium]